MTCEGDGPRRPPARCAILFARGALLAASLIPPACSYIPTSSGSAGPGTRGRVAGVFASTPVSAAPAGAGAASFNPSDCPSVDIRIGAESLTVSDKASDGTEADVRYELALDKLARQCALTDGNLMIKIGVQGRVILGPAGMPGPVEVPLRFSAIQEGIEQKTIATNFKRVGAEVPNGQDNVIFSDVGDDLIFPMPARTDLATYRVYVGLDEQGDATEKKPAAKKPAAKRKQ